MEPRVYVITGAPASGKSTVGLALARAFRRALYVPVDDLREWVVSGRADPVPWGDETEGQFRLAEESACDMARRYYRAGFAVVIDGCRAIDRLNELVQEQLSDLPVTKVVLLPTLECNQRRSRERTNKDFDPGLLDEVITWFHQHAREASLADWVALDTTDLTVDETVDRILSRTRPLN